MAQAILRIIAQWVIAAVKHVTTIRMIGDIIATVREFVHLIKWIIRMVKNLHIYDLNIA
jgi:hypothetical protein